MADKTPYIVSARKYRPATFSTVVGQDALTSTLKNAISTNRLAQAYLFCGPRGVGKTSCARIFAKTINCLNPTADGEACGECESCRAIERGTSFNLIELDAASNNSVDDIRNLTDQVNVPPQMGRYRVFIIDEVHMLSTQAFNAFLKTLEEPPSYVVFILATTEKHKVIPTILSRCQIYDFKRITIADMVSHLESVAASEGIGAEAAGLNVIARKADGAMRDALSIFDQVAASSGGNITYASAVESLNVLDYDFYFRLVDAFAVHDVQGALMLYKEIRDKGFDSLFFINGLAGHVRDLMVAYTPQTVPLLEVSGDIAERYLQQARQMPIDWYYEALQLLNDCDLNYRVVTDKRLHVELCLVRLCRIGVSSAVRQVAEPQPVPSGQTPAGPQPNHHPDRQPAATSTAATAASQRVSNPKEAMKAAVRGAGAAPRVPRISTTVARPTAQTPTAEKTPGPVQPTQEAASAESDAGSDAGVSEQRVNELWVAFADSHPDRQVLASTMRSSKLRREPSGQYTVLVPHAGAMDVIKAGLREIVDYLRAGLGVKWLTLTAEVVQQQRTRILTPRESLAKVVRQNKVLYDLLDSLNVEIV